MKTSYLLAAMTICAAPFSVALADAIEGTVKDASTGAPLAGAVVSIIQSVGNDRKGGSVGEVKYQEIAGANGGFTISGVAPGSYSATATYPGYKPVGQTGITVTAGQTVPLNLSLGKY